MPSIIEKVTQAEEQAARIKKEEAAAARERIALAKAEAQRCVEEAAAMGRDRVREAALRAEAEGGEIAAQIKEKNFAEADRLCEKAAEKLPQAAAYILERVVKA